MERKADEVLRPLAKFFGALQLPHKKRTAEMETVALPHPSVVTIPLKQNIGAACEPLVKVGDTVLVGTKIGDSNEKFSAPIHSSISGVVKGIADLRGADGNTVRGVVIESDGRMAEERFTPPVINTAEDLVNAARECGLVGLGGAGFPTHVKIESAIPDTVDTLIINAAECEPYITSDYRTCMEQFDNVIEGALLLKEMLNLKEVIIAVEENKPEAIKKLYEIVAKEENEANEIKVMRLSSRYPQGAEKVLVYTATRRKVPFGKLPADVGCLVMNVTSVAVLCNFIKTGRPLVEKVITVDGDAITAPKNVLTPIGTHIRDLLAFCGAKENVAKVIYGGPMMGVAAVDDFAVITKQNNALLAFKEEKPLTATPCIRCGKCVAACPMNLTPSPVEYALKHGLTEKLEKLNVNYCIECGCCSYICPAAKPLTESMRTAKNVLRRNNNEK